MIGALAAILIPLAPSIALTAPAPAPHTLFVNLDARDPSAGSSIWRNQGTIGDFARVGHPAVQTIAGVKAVVFDGAHDAYRGPKSVPALEGNAPRTIEVWAYNPSIDSAEETMVAWGRRGGPEGTLLAFGWGRDPAFGAVAHWAEDLGWNGPPSPRHWHYLVYTYDGRTARVYDDTVEKASRTIAARTAPGFTINLAAENRADGSIQFRNEYDGTQQAGSLAIAAVTISAGALTPSQIARNFDMESARFGASRKDAEGLLAEGLDRFRAGGFTLKLLHATQTGASLSPGESKTSNGTSFDFLPGDRLMGRSSDGYYNLGDVTLRVRSGSGPWKSFSSAADHTRFKPLHIPGALAAGDLTPVGCPVTIHREWRHKNGKLVMRFTLANRTAEPVEIGAFGAAMVFNNLLTGRSLEEAHDRCSFADPYIGGEAGYLQVTRLNGHGPALLVLPERGTSFEAYRPLYDDPTPRDVTFEGFYEWMTQSKAYGDQDWKGVQPWNRPTSRMLQPGQSTSYGFEFVLAPGIQKIESTLIANKRPVVIGVPGYVLPTDQMGRLFIHSDRPIRAIKVDPAGAFRLRPDGRPTPHGWRGFTLAGKRVGRCRLTILYADGLRQFVQYNVIPPEATQVRRLGAFHASKQWFTDPKDPFFRTFSFMPFNRDTGRMVLQHSHSWFVGLSDEIGAGASVAMAMKNLGQPDPQEIALLEKYATHTLWGHVQNPDYSVRASLFYYEPRLFPGYYTIRGGWDKARSETTWRTFNYPHVAAVYWALYRLARDHRGLVKTQPWQWYLNHAYQTVMAIPKFAPGYAQFGLMVGSVFPKILRDLRREGWNKQAAAMEAMMRRRADHWDTLRYPFGSEMPWDSTGQSEIATWCRYFGFSDKVRVTVDAVLGYMPTVPNWAYNGAARRYFDAPVNGTKWPQIVRMTNHYGSSINSIPLLAAYEADPGNLYLLRVGYAGMSEVMANIDRNGFGSYGFDADPAVLQFDPNTADYGIAFYGYAHGAGAYAMHDPEFGWLGFGCNLREDHGRVEILPRDGFRKRVFIGPAGLSLTLDAGTFERVSFDPHSKRIEVTLSPANPWTPTALLRMKKTTPGRSFKPVHTLSLSRGGYAIPLGKAPRQIELEEHR